MTASTTTTLAVPADRIQTLARERSRLAKRNAAVLATARLQSSHATGSTCAARRRAGSLWAFNLGRVEAWLVAAVGGPRARRVAEFCAWLLTAERVLKAHVFTTRHADTADLLQISQRTAGDVVREAIDLGLVYQLPSLRWKCEGGVYVRQEGIPSYRSTERLRELVELRDKDLDRNARARVRALVCSWVQRVAKNANRETQLNSGDPERMSGSEDGTGSFQTSESQRLPKGESRLCALERALKGPPGATWSQLAWIRAVRDAAPTPPTPRPPAPAPVLRDSGPPGDVVAVVAAAAASWERRFGGRN